MRDQLKTSEHWLKMNESFEYNVGFHNELYDEVVATDGKESLAAHRARLFLKSDYLGHICALYSSGANISEIDEIFPNFVNLFVETWSTDSSYIELLWVLSLGIQLGSAHDQLRTLAQKLGVANYHDAIIDYLINYIAKKEITKTEGTLLYEVPYMHLFSAITASTKDDAALAIKVYLEKYWYSGHRDAGWHHSHKQKNGFYHGYWSFECGAIAKILDIDDTVLRLLQYYPYELVHYKK